MGNSRKTYAQLEKEIQALMKKQDEILDVSANLFTRTLMTSEIKRTISKESPEVIKRTARKVAASLSDIIEKEKKKGDEKEAVRQHPASIPPKSDEGKKKVDYSSAVLVSAKSAHPSGGKTSGTEAVDDRHY